MFWDHALKLFYNFKSQNDWQKFFTNLADKILGVTSLSSGLFLFLAGFSLVISFYQFREKGKKGWLLKKWRRGAWLIFLAYLLFFFEFQLTRPEAWLTPGILALIGQSLILSSLFFYLQPGLRIGLVAFLSCSILLLDLIWRTKNVQLPGINTYIFPWLPHSFYFFSGFLTAEIFFYQFKKNFAQNLRKLFWFSLIGLISLLSAFDFRPFFIFKARYVISGFWQPHLFLVVFNTLLITACLTWLAIREEKLQEIKLAKKVAALGQSALAIYFCHFLLGWGVRQYFLKEVKFGPWAPVSAVVIFTLLGKMIAGLKGIIKFKRKI